MICFIYVLVILSNCNWLESHLVKTFQFWNCHTRAPRDHCTSWFSLWQDIKKLFHTNWPSMYACCTILTHRTTTILLSCVMKGNYSCSLSIKVGFVPNTCIIYFFYSLHTPKWVWKHQKYQKTPYIKIQYQEMA